MTRHVHIHLYPAKKAARVMRRRQGADSLIGSVTTGIRRAASAVRKAPDLIHNVNASAR